MQIIHPDDLSAPVLLEQLEREHGLDPETAQRAASAILDTLSTVHGNISHGTPYAQWSRTLPAALVALIVELGAEHANNPFSADHELRTARALLGELAVRISR